jgi:hypothetical protein
VLRVTIAPPSGAAFESVTVQVLLVPAPIVDGVQPRDEMTVVAARVMFTVWEVPLYDALTVPF